MGGDRSNFNVRGLIRNLKMFIVAFGSHKAIEIRLTSNKSGRAVTAENVGQNRR